MKFKKDAIKPRMVIHCPKEEDARALLEHLDSLGYVWSNGANICVDYSRWHEYCDRTGYQILLSSVTRKITNGGVDSYLCKITEFSDLIEPDEESESANFIKSGEKIAEGISKAIKDAESSIENSAGGEKSTDTSTGMTNQRAIEILSDYIERNEHIIHDPETEAIRIATSTLAEKEANKNAEKVNVLTDKYKQAKKQDEMTAAEVLEWLEQYGGTQVAEKVFGLDSDGYVVDADNVLDIYSPQEILDKITTYEASKKEKPVEVEWVDICRIIQIQDNGVKKCVYEEDLKPETPFDTDPDLKEQSEAILKKYISEHEGRYIAVMEGVCRVKGE